jgi:hypothetical protein
MSDLAKQKQLVLDIMKRFRTARLRWLVDNASRRISDEEWDEGGPGLSRSAEAEAIITALLPGARE